MARTHSEWVCRFALGCLLMAGSSPIWAQKVLDEGIMDLASQIASRMASEQKKKIAVLPFRELDGRVTVLGTYASEELVTDLFQQGGLEIVERTLLEKVMGELKLGQSGAIDPETARQVGKVAGVDAIVAGTVTELQSYVSLNCRLIDAQTGKIFAAAAAKIVKNDDLRSIMNAPTSSVAGVTPEGSRASGQGAAPPPAPKAADAGFSQVVRGFRFDLGRCALTGSEVTCELLVTDVANDAQLVIFVEGSRVFDDLGTEALADRVALGTSTANKHTHWAETDLVSGVPLKAGVHFVGVSAQATKLTLLEIAISRENRGPRSWSAESSNEGAIDLRGEAKLQFRNVPLQSR